MIRVTLTPDQLRQADICGLRRDAEARRMGLPPAYGTRDDRDWTRTIHLEGARGELACALALDVWWEATVNTFHAPDLPYRIQVRTRSQPHYQLIVRRADADDEAFVLVRGTSPTYDVVGWVYGHEAKRPSYLHWYGQRPAAYFVPDEALRPLTDLRALIDSQRRIA